MLLQYAKRYARPTSSLSKCIHFRAYGTALAYEPLESVVASVEHPAPPKAFSLRPYQEHCIQACLDSLRKDNVNRIGVSSPTGSGKTTIFCSLIERMEPPMGRPQATQALILVGSIELARQAATQFKRLHPDLTVEIEQGQKHKASGFADVTVATYQTLTQSDRLQKFCPSRFKVVVVDEAHHSLAPSYLRILSHFNPSIETKELDSSNTQAQNATVVPVVGFSATFNRHDGLALGKVFQEIVYHRDFLEMMKEKWLCNVAFTTVRTTLDLSHVTINNRTGDFVPTSLAQVVNTDTINNVVFRTWLHRAADRKSTLIFCVNIQHVNDLTAAFRANGVDARSVSGKTPPTERKTLLEEFKKGVYPVLVNCAILTEGADVPNIDCVIVARPTRSKTVFAQMIGRGMRLSPETGKLDCRIIDFVDSLERVGKIVSAPTLFGLDPDTVAEAVDIEGDDVTPASGVSSRLQAAPGINGIPSRDRLQGNVPTPISITYEDFDDPFSLADEASGAKHINEISPFSWVSCGHHNYVLDCLGKGFIKIQVSNPTALKSKPPGETHHPTGHNAGTGPTEVFVATFTPAADRDELEASQGSPFYRKKELLKATELDQAVKGCDNFASSIVANAAFRLNRYAKWRQQPATDKQKQFVSGKWNLKLKELTLVGAANPTDEFSLHAKNGSKPMDIDSLTKGQAANIITRVKHGAMRHYARKLKSHAMHFEKEAKQRQKLEGEVVRVGPLLWT